MILEILFCDIDAKTLDRWIQNVLGTSKWRHFWPIANKGREMEQNLVQKNLVSSSLSFNVSN